MSNLKSWKEKAKKKEEHRIGDVYSECEKRGCDHSFLVSFNTRAEMFPVQQTRSFLSMTDYPADKIRQWKIYLEVLIEKRPESEMQKDWKKSLEILKNER